jgi:hypothetical protein
MSDCPPQPLRRLPANVRRHFQLYRHRLLPARMLKEEGMYAVDVRQALYYDDQPATKESLG